MKNIYLITGPAGAGKSTISNMLAKSLDKSVLLEGDDLYHQVIGGYVSPWKDGNHVDLMWHNACLLIKSYLDNGYDIVFNYIVKPANLELIKERFSEYQIKFIVLMVDPDTLIKRDQKRPIDCQMNERCLILLDNFKKYNYDQKYILNTSEMSVEECVSNILENEGYIV